MVGETAVPEPAPEEVDGQHGGRERSTILFPYADLDAAVKVAKAIHRVGGTTCQLETLAAELKVEQAGGAFRMMIYTAKIFTLVSYGQGSIQLTTLGSQIADSKHEKTARVTAFLNVPLYKAMYERFKVGTLPPQASALESEIINLGVAKKQAERARQTFMRSAQQAGFFAYGQDRLVMPPVSREAPSEEDRQEQLEDKGKRNGRGDDDGTQRHPLISGLIKTLPQEGSEWGIEDRGKWLQAAATIFELIYKNTKDGRRSVIVKIEDSAK